MFYSKMQCGLDKASLLAAVQHHPELARELTRDELMLGLDVFGSVLLVELCAGPFSGAGVGL